jgi:hypothetical protein
MFTVPGVFYAIIAAPVAVRNHFSTEIGISKFKIPTEPRYAKR